MAGSSSEESGISRSLEGQSNGQQRGDAIAECRSSEQVENGITSTSPPYWDIEDDDDCGPKPSELFGKYTWKIDKFSQITKRELRSNVFEVGGYKWYILIYPQGCDVCHHLSLFLCVANHDKLLPGWGHFAQFTIAVVNKDPKKSKYSDTLHRFWKKEHDWGWKKFMESSKVTDGFLDADSLIIKAQVQVLRERQDRPFRCLDTIYRRELVRVYLSNVEQICRRCVEERRARLGKLIEDKVRWSSFCTFWLGIDQTSRRRMSREKSDSILKVVVRHFFIEKEVTSTLVMDSLYSGLKALEGQSQSQTLTKGKLDAEANPIPVVRMETDTFVLGDDVLLLLERAALEPLPPKDEKGPQNRTKDGGSGEDFSKDCDERRLTELGRRTIEIFVLVHIFSTKIDVAYQEAVALKRQEELIREEEEEAWMAETEQKAKRAADKEKKSKKKQAKQKRNNNRKSKEKGRDEKQSVVTVIVEEKPEEPGSPIDLPETVEDVSDVSDSADCVTESSLIRPDSDDRDSSPINWDTDTSDPHHPPTEACVISAQNGGQKSNFAMDDSSSTCSTDSLPSVVISGPYRGNSNSQKTLNSSTSGKVTRGKASVEVSPRVNNIQKPPTSDEVACDEDVVKKVEEVVTLQKKLSIKEEVEPEKQLKEKITVSVTPSSPKSPSKSSPWALVKKTASNDSVITRTEKPVVHLTQKPTEKPVVHLTQKPAEKPVVQQVAVKPVTKPAPPPPMPRPLSAPLAEGSRPNVTAAPVSSMVQTGPFLSRSASAAGYLGPDPSPVGQSYGLPSYRNAMMGSPVSSAHSHSYSHPVFLPQTPERIDTSNSIGPSFSFGLMNPDIAHQNGPQWMESYNNIRAQGMLADEFPHLDIINDLLDDEYSNPSASNSGPGLGPFHNGPRHLSHQFTFPGDILGSVDQIPSTSSCRFDRTRSFHEEFQHGYGFDLSRDMGPQQPNLQPYVNGLVQNQWQIGGSDLSYGLRNMDSDGYSYHMPHDYSGLTMGVNGYTVYRPSNGQ